MTSSSLTLPGRTAHTTARPSSSPWTALPVIISGAFMVVLDFFIVNVALPSIATDLGAGSASLEWIVAGYGLTVAAFLITAGRLGDNHGRRRLNAIGVALFTLASIGCGIAPTATTLILARVVQGVAGALLMPQVLAIIGVAFQGADRAKAMGVYSMALGLAAVGGQLIGGVLVHADVAGLGWRSCFLINVPVGLAALALTPRLVPESRATRPARLDLLGVALVTLGVLAVTLPLVEGRQHGWPAWTWVSFGLAPFLLVLFVGHQRRRARRGGALLDLTLFRERTFSAGMGLCFTSLNHIVLETLDDQRAGSASGVMATVQELGNALGVAITGVIFFGAASSGLGHAFELGSASSMTSSRPTRRRGSATATSK